MKPRNERAQWHLISKKIDFVSGTAVRKISAGTAQLVTDLSTKPDLALCPVFFDWQQGLPNDETGLLELDRQSLQGLGAHVLAALTRDPEALQEAERRGLLRYLPEGWYTNPGPSLDNMGALADPRIAVTLALINELLLRRKIEQAIQQRNSHDFQTASALGDNDAASCQARAV